MSDHVVHLTIPQLRDIIREAVRSEVERIRVTPPPDVLNLKQAADLLDRHPTMVMRYVKEGKLTAHFISAREPRFYRRDVMAYLDTLPTKPAVPEYEMEH